MDPIDEGLMLNARNCQADALGLLADRAADVGDTELEQGYRWLAEHGKWPQHYRSSMLIGRECWVWEKEPSHVDRMTMLPPWARKYLGCPGGDVSFVVVIEDGARAVAKGVAAFTALVQQDQEASVPL